VRLKAKRNRLKGTSTQGENTPVEPVFTPTLLGLDTSVLTVLNYASIEIPNLYPVYEDT
jgi:hypothetical protein